MSLQVLVIEALPPLSRPRLCDMRLSIQRWLVLAFPSESRSPSDDAVAACHRLPDPPLRGSR
jgi:hypothetical protein